MQENEKSVTTSEYDVLLAQEEYYFLVVTTGTNDYNESVGQQYKFKKQQNVLLFINQHSETDIYGEVCRRSYYEIIESIQEIKIYNVKYTYEEVDDNEDIDY